MLPILPSFLTITQTNTLHNKPISDSITPFHPRINSRSLAYHFFFPTQPQLHLAQRHTTIYIIITTTHSRHISHVHNHPISSTHPHRTLTLPQPPPSPSHPSCTLTPTLTFLYTHTYRHHTPSHHAHAHYSTPPPVYFHHSSTMQYTHSSSSTFISLPPTSHP